MQNYIYSNPTDSIVTDISKGVIEITGIFSCEEEILDEFDGWLDNYLVSPHSKTELCFHIADDIEPSAKAFLSSILRKCNAFANAESIIIYWYYSDLEQKTYELGKELEKLFEKGFVFKKEITGNKASALELIRKANNAVEQGILAQSFKFFNQYVEYHNEKWKQAFVYKLANNIIHSNVLPVFVGKEYDLLLTTEKDLSDDEFSYGVYLTYFFESSQSQVVCNSRYEAVIKRLAEVKEMIEMVLDDDYDLFVKALVLARDSKDCFINHNLFQIEEGLILYANLETFDLQDLFNSNELDEVSDDYRDFTMALGKFLIEEEKKSVEDNCSEPIDKVVTPPEPVIASSKVRNIASNRFIEFVDKSRVAFDNYSEKNTIFQLSPNMVFLTHGNIEITKLAKYYSNIALKNFSVNVDSFNFRTISSQSELASKLSSFSDKIIVIANLEKELNAERNLTLDVSREDLMNFLCDHIEKDKCNLYVLGMSRKSWEALSAQYQCLKICFQHVFEFSEYTAENMLHYYQKELEKIGGELHYEARDLVLEYFAYMKQNVPPSHYRPMLSKMLARESKLNAILRKPVEYNHLVCVQRGDVENSIKDEYQSTHKLSLREVSEDLDKLVGLSKVKNQVKELSALVKMEQLRKESDATVSLNSLFLGNPGTGKTTVAESYGQIFKSIGVLPKGHVVTAKRHDIVGQYIGETARQMKKLIDQSYGGILFIDEAYALYKSDNDRDYGHEAIDTLVSELELMRNTSCVVLAGYPDKMMHFLDSNPGLRSRFPNTIHFEDYTVEELLTIFNQLIHSGGYKLDDEAMPVLKEIIAHLVVNKDHNFGNARECRNHYEKLKLIQAARIIYDHNQEHNDINQFTKADVEKLAMASLSRPNNIKRNKIGY
ncbi:SiaC family regulatory phosphoprotein [Carboxylicivirga sp. A043]|uniref:SiaC family regulatory phosphoprotein n=1 Tax=Carboxylicivirga litoralis TaxID=2816963 RepID=UPI0021CB5487|nr:SiaC family regulatory phosphoprotein [Carboxylicivirga sp. A043]MCU4156133.1 SiaC family regulatory phosphoprotein [Carboxylicivirga sp. A043]